MPLIAVVLVACGGGAGGEAPSVDGDAAATSVDGTRLIAALCETQDLAQDPDEAARAFQAGAHGPLHELAGSVTDVDRGVAAQLHEAKQRAESALAAGDPDEIEGSVTSLTSATRTSLELLGRSAPACGDGDS